MQRLKNKTGLWVYRFLALRDGEKCLLCRKKPNTKRRLDIDHIDCNHNNEDPGNLCLLCSQCNRKLEGLTPPEHKRLMQKRYAQCVCECVCEKGQPATIMSREAIDYSRGNPEMRANDLYEVKFREWVLSQVRVYGSYPKQEAINSGAEFTGSSPATITRYLDKLTSLEGCLKLSVDGFGQKLLYLKSNNNGHANLSIDDLIIQAKQSRGHNDNHD